MKKVIKICVMIVFCICIFAKGVYAADSNIFSMTNATGSKGDEVILYINLDKELEFASADIVLEYDTSKLEYVEYDELDILKKSAMNIVKNNSDTGKIAIGYVSNPDTTSLVKSPGQMLSITFRIKGDEGDTIKLNLKCTSLKKDSGENIQVDDVQSEIKVVAKINGETPTSTDSDTKTDTKTDTDIKTDTKTNTDDNKIESKENNQKAPKTVLPKTGSEVSIISILLILCTIIIFYFYKKYIYLKNIK